MNKIERSIIEIREFGWKYFIRYRLIGRIRGREYKQQATLDYLRDRYGWIARTEFLPMCVEPNPYLETIWVCWWQGEEQMPPIVRACYTSLKKHCNGHPIKLITKENYRQYVKLPKWVETKFQEGRITITHLSDILRVVLLSQYGGLWMDATLYLAGDLPKKIPYFFTLKQVTEMDDVFVSKHRWTGFCLGGSVNNPLWGLAYEILLNRYWKEHDYLIEYYILDFIIDIIYKCNTPVRRWIDCNEYSNPDLAFFSTRCNQEFDKNVWNEVSQRTKIFKLSWKGDIRERTNSGNYTYNGFIIAHE